MGHMTLFRVNATFASPSRQLRELVPLARGEAPRSCLPAFLSVLPPVAGKFALCSLVLAPELVCNRSGQPPAADGVGQLLAHNGPENNIGAQSHGHDSRMGKRAASCVCHLFRLSDAQ